MMIESKKNIYLDYAATTPIHPVVVETMMDCYENTYANPSSLHRSGRQAKQVLEEARSVFAAGLGATQTNEIIFTGSGSEADNLALIGVALTNQGRGKHLITSEIEHHAILHTCEYLAANGFEVSYLPVDEFGFVHPETLKNTLREDTTIVSIMHANNEIGTIQPIAELAEITHEWGAVFHTDAVQTAGQLKINVQDMNVDLLTVSAHKFYGPKGIGALYVRDGINLTPLIHGGGQESHRRAGTENLPGVIGAAKALELALGKIENESARLTELRQELWQRLASDISDIRLNGHPTDRLPNNLNVSFKGIEAEGLILRMSMQGLEASMGSACNSESIEPSHVIRALDIPEDWARGALRVTLGSYTTLQDIADASEIITSIVRDMQQ